MQLTGFKNFQCKLKGVPMVDTFVKTKLFSKIFYDVELYLSENRYGEDIRDTLYPEYHDLPEEDRVFIEEFEEYDNLCDCDHCERLRTILRENT